MKREKIENYENYEITDGGQVFSLAGLEPRELKQRIVSQSKKGYLQVSLYNDECKRTKKGQKLPKQLYVHRLVWETFMGEIPAGKEIDHIDGNPRNNKLSNLQVITKRQNLLKAIKDNPNYIWLRPKREELLKEYSECGDMIEMAKKYGVQKTTMWRIIKNKTHRRHPDGKTYVESWSDDCTDLFETTDLRNKSKEFIKELWKKNLAVKSS